MGRWRVLVVNALVLGVVAVPLVTDRDSFPHSTYPMFAVVRQDRATLNVAHGLDADGAIVRLEPETIAGSAEIVHAAETIGSALAAGDEDRLCAEIAERVARRGPDTVTTIVVGTERHDLVASVAGDQVPLERTERARCEVPR